MKSFFELIEPSESCTGILPYIKGTTEPLSSTLRKHNIKVCNKPSRTLQQEFPSIKHRPPTEEKTDVVYKIPCKYCTWNYIGETGRSLKTRKAEHIRNVKQQKNGSKIARHAWDNGHIIEFDNAQVIHKGNFRCHLTLESWHTTKDRNADNNSRPLPRQYTVFNNKEDIIPPLSYFTTQMYIRLI